MEGQRITLSGAEVFEILKRTVEVRQEDFTALHALPDGPLGLLIAIVLSQNSSDRNSIRAYDRLKETTSLDPRRILELGDGLKDIIRPAGMIRQKSEAIRAISRLVLERGEGYLGTANLEELRRELESIRGVGRKTVDVFLSIYRGVPVFAVDTHAKRVAARWGLVRKGASYEEVSRAMLEFFGPERAGEAHRLVIAFGRAYCRARSPRCSMCPLRNHCPSAVR